MFPLTPRRRQDEANGVSRYRLAGWRMADFFARRERTVAGGFRPGDTDPVPGPLASGVGVVASTLPEPVRAAAPDEDDFQCTVTPPWGAVRVPAGSSEADQLWSR